MTKSLRMVIIKDGEKQLERYKTALVTFKVDMVGGPSSLCLSQGRNLDLLRKTLSFAITYFWFESLHGQRTILQPSQTKVASVLIFPV